MIRLEDLGVGARVRGLDPRGPATVVQTQWVGSQALEVVYRDESGGIGSRLLLRDDEASLAVDERGRAWSFDGDGEHLRLAAEAHRIRLAHLFDPYLAVHTSRIEPLPHQITAVYQHMLNRQPLRFLLADDPGAGKTIMTGLLVKELMVRADLERCLVVSPGSLVEQWQDELHDKFGLHFDILSRDMIEASRSGNPFEEKGLLIARLDVLSRNDDLQEKLRRSPHWDLVVCDEAHKMSASYFGGEIKMTKRHKLGRALGGVCRHFLLLTATPHNGKEEDFQLFLSLLDGDRFEGKFRDGVHKADAGDLMRRLVKEQLLRFDGTPLFPERRAYTASYELSPEEAALYEAVTTYVRDEMNRAERFANQDDQRRVNVGFALQTLQRRLASSPEAIYRSLNRRRERLEARLEEEKTFARGRDARLSNRPEPMPLASEDDFDDLEDAPEDEIEEAEDKVLDHASAAATIAELEAEIETLRRLESEANTLRLSRRDTKWNQLNSILDHPLMTDADGNRRKLIVFTEPRDTLHYLAERIRQRLGKPEAVVEIHGGVGREERRKAVHAFTQDKNVLVLVANDAAGEGVNLQRAHLMVNYDLPWNPNRLEQRFGRIHRIGQREVCHLWNLVASGTREGEVYKRLLEKLEVAREALGGKVYDVLGELFRETPLRSLLVDAIRYGERDDVRARRDRALGEVDRNHIDGLLRNRALVPETMDVDRVTRIREAMERAEAQRLQPLYIRAFFLRAFERLGGKVHAREAGRYEVTHVPGSVRDRDRQTGLGAAVLERYERITFEKDHVDRTPRADLICPGHPLFDATLDLTLEALRPVLRQGAILIDEDDPGEDPRLLYVLEHAVRDGRTGRNGEPQIVSQRLQFVELHADGGIVSAGPAPYLDYRPATDDERALLSDTLSAPWLSDDPESRLLAHAATNDVAHHLREVRDRVLPLVDKTRQQVATRLKKEINYWDHRAEDLKAQERAGKKTRLSSDNAAQRADELAARLRRRNEELDLQANLAALSPRVTGGALIVPAGLLRRLRGEPGPVDDAYGTLGRDEVERRAMEAVFEAERGLGRETRDVHDRPGLGYDIESKDPATGSLYFLEVKGRFRGRDVVTLTRSEISASRNSPDRWRLAIVTMDEHETDPPRYVVDAGFNEPDWAETTRNYSLRALLERAGEPR